jgi:hypothetical protein
MKMKKTSYESPGFVRRLLKKGSSFKSLSGGESLNDSFTTGNSIGRFGNSEGNKWRPRKNKFELLDCDDDDSLSALKFDNSSSWNTENAFSSAESQIQEYKQGIMFEQKIPTQKKTPVKMRCMDRKRELTPIKPPCNDTSEIRAPTSSAKKAPEKKQRQEAEWDSNNRQDDLNFSKSNETAASDDPFFKPTTDSFGFKIKNNAKKPSVISRNSSYNSVVSDQTDFFSKEQTTQLTTNNLAKMDSALDTITNSTPKNNSTTNGLEKLVKERKFYQFAIDEDRASTVVESTIQLPADYPDGNYSIDEISCDETSQGTRIQHQRSSLTSQEKEQPSKGDSDFFPKNTKIITTSETAQDILATSSHSRKHASEVKEFDAFFPSDIGAEKGKGKKFDTFFPPSIGKDSFFPDFGGTKETTQHISPQAETDASSFGGSDYFDPRHMSTNSLKHGSAKSLAYSVSPSHTKKSDVVAQTSRQPLTLKNPQTDSGKKKNKSFQANVVPKKFDQDNEWIVSENVGEQEANFQFDDVFARPSSSKKKRHSSISSSNVQPPPANHFEASPNKVSAKENFSMKPNRHEDLDNNWGINQNKQQQYQQILRRDDQPIRKSVYDQDFDSDEDDDGFDDVGQWERPAPTSIGRGVYGSQNSINRARITRQSQESFNRQSRNQYIDDDDDDDARSASGFSVGKVSRSSASGSRTKPLAMPSNAIVASMLFQTQYDIDQNDVENKINAFEQENSRQRRVRTSQGGIPDAVNTDEDYMTTVSSFSEGTSAYLQQDTWRKPSRDLLNHFTSARALDMDYRQRPLVRTSRIVEQRQGLYEA